MFQSLLDTRIDAVPRSYRSFGVAFGLHAMLFAVVIFGSYLVVGTIAPPNLVDMTLQIVTLPPPEGGSGGRPAVVPTRKKDPAVAVTRPQEPVQPVTIPDPIPQETAPPMDAPGVEGPDFGTSTEDAFGPGHGGPGQGNGRGDGVGDGDGPRGSTGFKDDAPIFLDATVSKPELLERVQPKYPEVARRAGIPGTVLVQAVISSTGEVESVEVLSSTNPIFDAAAKDAVRRWRYRPAMQNGRPIAVYFTVEVRFLLQ